MAAYTSRRISEFFAGYDWAAEHYHPAKLAAVSRLALDATTVIRDHVVSSKEIRTPKSTDEGYYDTGAASGHVLPTVPPNEEERVSSKKLARGGDVLISRLRSYLRQVAVVPLSKPEALVSTEFIVLRPALENRVFWILPYLLCSRVQTCLAWSQDGNQHPRFDEDVLLGLPVPSKVAESSSRLSEIVEEAVQLKLQAAQHFAAAERRLEAALDLRISAGPIEKTYARRFSDLRAEGRFDAEYFSPRHQALIARLRTGGLKLGEVAPLGNKLFNPKVKGGAQSFNYVEIGDLVDGEAGHQEVNTAEVPSRAKWILDGGDIITSTVRPIRRLSALIRGDQAGFVCSSGFAVLQPTKGKGDVEPELVLAYLRLPAICTILDLNCTASMYPAISEERLLNMPFVLPDARSRSFVVSTIQQGMNARSKSSQLLAEAIAFVDELTI